MDSLKNFKSAYIKKEVVESINKPKKVTLVEVEKSAFNKFIYNPYTIATATGIIGFISGYILAKIR